MTDCYAIDVTEFLDLSARISGRLDALAATVEDSIAALDEVQDAVAGLPALSGAVSAAADPWRVRAREVPMQAGAVLTAVQAAVAEYCRADVAMALNTESARLRAGTGRWRVA